MTKTERKCLTNLLGANLAQPRLNPSRTSPPRATKIRVTSLCADLLPSACALRLTGGVALCDGTAARLHPTASPLRPFLRASSQPGKVKCVVCPFLAGRSGARDGGQWARRKRERALSPRTSLSMCRSPKRNRLPPLLLTRPPPSPC